MVVEPTSLTFPEGASRTYPVVLTSQPTATVEVAVDARGNDDVTTDEASVSFAPVEWNVKRTVRVGGAEEVASQQVVSQRWT